MHQFHPRIWEGGCNPTLVTSSVRIAKSQAYQLLSTMVKQPTNQNTDMDTTYTLHDGIVDVGDRMAGLSPGRLDEEMAKLVCSVKTLDFDIVAPLFPHSTRRVRFDTKI